MTRGKTGLPSKLIAERLRERKDEVLSRHAAELTPSQLKLANWLACPEPLRFPFTLKSLAKELGVTEQTVHGWKREPEVIDCWKELSMVYESEYQAYAVIRELGRQALTGSVYACKNYLQAIGAMAPQKVAVAHQGKVEVVAESINNLSDQDLDRLLKALEKRKQKTIKGKGES